MNFSSFFCVFMSTAASISISKRTHSTTNLHIVCPEVFRYWKSTLGRSVGPECGISELRSLPNPPKGPTAEKELMSQVMCTARQKYKDTNLVYDLILTANKNQPCYRDLIPIVGREKETMLIRYQYPIQEKKELRELEQLENKAWHGEFKAYGSDTGFLVLEYLYEVENTKWIQKNFRISADWEGLTDQIRSMHRSGKQLGGKRIKRLRAQ